MSYGQGIYPSRIRGVGVKYVIIFLEEDTQTQTLAFR